MVSQASLDSLSRSKQYPFCLLLWGFAPNLYPDDPVIRPVRHTGVLIFPVIIADSGAIGSR